MLLAQPSLSYKELTEMAYRDLLLAKEYLNLLQGVVTHPHEDPEKQRQKGAVRKRQMTVRAKRSDQSYLSLGLASTVLVPREPSIQMSSKQQERVKTHMENRAVLGKVLP